MRADLRRFLSRRATWAAVLAGIFSVVLFSGLSHSELQDARRQLVRAAAPIDWEKLSKFGHNTSSAATRRLFEQRKSEEVAALTKSADAAAEHLGTRLLHINALGFLGSLPGVAIAILLASSLFGAEFRWHYWPSALMQHRSRRRLLLSKLTVLSLMLFVWLLAMLGATYISNALFSLGSSHPVLSGIPDVSHVASALGGAWLGMTFFGVFSAAVVIFTMSTLAGAATSGVFAILAGALSSKIVALRALLPVQSIAWLLPKGDETTAGVDPMWFPRIELRLVRSSVAEGLTSQQFEPLPAIGTAVAAVVLCVWLLLSVAGADWFFRKRDVPA